VASTCFAAERSTHGGVVRASAIKGARVTFEGGGSAGTIQDVVLDPQTGCARFVILQTGDRVVAAPYRILRSGGEGSYTVTVDRERLIGAPVVSVERIQEFSDPAFTQRVYRYYGTSEGEGGGVTVRGRTTITEPGRREGDRNMRQGEAGMEDEGRPGAVGERSRQRQLREQQQGSEANPSASPQSREGTSRQSPSPVGERGTHRHQGTRQATPGAVREEDQVASPSPAQQRRSQDRSIQQQERAPRGGESESAQSPSSRSQHSPGSHSHSSAPESGGERSNE